MPDIVRFRKANLLSILVNLKKIKFLIECIAFKANTVRIIKYTFIDEDSIEFNRYPNLFLSSFVLKVILLKARVFSFVNKNQSL